VLYGCRREQKLGHHPKNRLLGSLLGKKSEKITTDAIKKELRGVEMWRSAFRNGEQNDGELRREDRKKTKKSRDKVEPAEIPDDSRNDKPATRRERLLSRKSKKKKNKNNAASSVDAKAMARASSEVEDTLDEVASLPHNRSRNSLSRFLLQRGGNNMRVVYRSFGPDASEVLNLEIEEGIPSPEQPNHVVIKIQVRMWVVVKRW
jgi:hypothetical protein